MNRGLAFLIAIIGGALGAWVLTMVGTTALSSLFDHGLWSAGLEQALHFAMPIAGVVLWAILGWLIWTRLTAPPEAD